MRPLKFRAWDKEMKQFTYFNLPDISCAGIGACDNNDDIQQSIDLNDKKGKAVYEGDIVQLNQFKIEIKWNNQFSRFTNKEDYSGFSSKNIQILGNIYENPKLLKDIK